MTRRSKQNSKYWNNRAERLLELKPEYIQIKYIYDTLYRLLQERYPFIKELEYEQAIAFIKDILYMDRKMREYRIGHEQELKDILSQETQLELGYTPNYKQDIKKLKTL